MYQMVIIFHLCFGDVYHYNIKGLKKWNLSNGNNFEYMFKGSSSLSDIKGIKINCSSCKCDICQGYIKDKNIFSFPCAICSMQTV